MTEHIAVLVNPEAGKGEGRDAARQVIAHLTSRGATVREYVGANAAESLQLAVRALAENPRTLVVVGGDGTLSGILPALLSSKIPVTFVAAGTGNDFARALDLPHNDHKAATELAFTGVPRVVDVGEITASGRTAPFLTVAALGFDATVAERTNKLRWPRGALRYYLALVIELARLKPMAFTYAVDNASPQSAPGTVIAIGNTSSYGGGMPMCADALPDDGRLDVVHVGPLSRTKLVRIFPRLLKGTHLTHPVVTHHQAHTVSVSAPGLIIYADGERFGDESCTVTIRPQALTLLVAKA